MMTSQVAQWFPTSTSGKYNSWRKRVNLFSLTYLLLEILWRTCDTQSFFFSRLTYFHLLIAWNSMAHSWYFSLFLRRVTYFIDLLLKIAWHNRDKSVSSSSRLTYFHWLVAWNSRAHTRYFSLFLQPVNLFSLTYCLKFLGCIRDKSVSSSSRLTYFHRLIAWNSRAHTRYFSLFFSAG